MKVSIIFKLNKLRGQTEPFFYEGAFQNFKFQFQIVATENGFLMWYFSHSQISYFLTVSHQSEVRPCPLVNIGPHA